MGSCALLPAVPCSLELTASSWSRGCQTCDYTPGPGDIIWLTLSPVSGHEQAGRRPALVLSPAAYNAKVGLALCCPITSHVKGYPFEVELPAGLPVGGAVLSDQVRSLDWRARRAELACKAPSGVLPDVMNRLAVLLPLSA